MKNLIKNILLFFGSLFSIKNVLIFESHADYSDNARSFYEYLIKKKYNKRYKIYWFVNNANEFKNRETDNVYFLTMWKDGTKKTFFQWLRYFWIAKNAKYLIFSNRNLVRVNRKTKTVCINHGIAIKSIKNRRMIPLDVNYRVDASEFCAHLVMDQQGLKREQVIVVGNPRNDVIFNKTNVDKKLIEFKKYKKIILWLPTFRKSYHSDRVDSTHEFPLGIPIIYSSKMLDDMNNYLKKLNVVIILKLHPAQDLSVFKAKSLSNIIILDDKYLISKDVELTELYKITDALITDYSSVYVDYLLTQKPIGFTVDDFNDYKIGFSMENIQDYMPGVKINDIEELKMFVDNLIKNVDEYKKERKRVNAIFNEFNDGNSSERLAKKLEL